MPRMCVIASLSVSVALASAASANVNLTLVPAMSSLTASGDASGAPFVPQGPGGDVTSYSGSMQISDPGASFSFLSADTAAANSGDWGPLPGGMPGLAPANYGLHTMILAFGVDGAARDLRFGLSSPGLPLSGGSFSASDVTLTVLGGSLDYNAVIFAGNAPLTGMTSLAGSGMGSLMVSGSDVTLTVPVDSSFTVVANGIPVTVELRGNLVATGTVPAPAGAAALGGLVLFGMRRRR